MGRRAAPLDSARIRLRRGAFPRRPGIVHRERL